MPISAHTAQEGVRSRLGAGNFALVGARSRGNFCVCNHCNIGAELTPEFPLLRLEKPPHLNKKNQKS